MAKIWTNSEIALEGDVVIDTERHVVFSGFINLHAHGQSIGDYGMQAMQGLTTALECESRMLPVAEWYGGHTK